jgi:hypothetical protein
MTISINININMINTNSQSAQDIYILNVLKFKKDGYFLEIGSNDPININNTYVLESEYNWKGLMVEYNPIYEQMYKSKRPQSLYVIQDATTVDYYNIFKTNNFPNNMDYLQIDLEVQNASTINTLKKLDVEIFDEYKFATVTFEHDIYVGNHYNTREVSREIFSKRGYVLVFGDVRNSGNMYEDWYVHPDLVDMDYINKIKNNKSMEYTEIVKLL